MGLVIHIGNADVEPAPPAPFLGRPHRLRKAWDYATFLASLSGEDRAELAGLMLAGELYSGPGLDWLKERGAPSWRGPRSRDHDRGPLLYLRLNVARVQFPDAPAFPNDELTGRSNARHPSYPGWAYFFRSCGPEFERLWNDPGACCGLTYEPGVFALRPEHLEVTHRALADFRSRMPQVRPGFEPEYHTKNIVRSRGAFPEGGRNGEAPGAVLARLLWCEWWMAWATNNCRNPAVKND